MVNFPDLSNLSSGSGIGGILSLPNATYPYFWAWILGGIWAIITLSLYFKEKELRGVGHMLSSMSVACLAIIILSTIGTIVGFVPLMIMIYILVLSLLIIGVWFFTND